MKEKFIIGIISFLIQATYIILYQKRLLPSRFLGEGWGAGYVFLMQWVFLSIALILFLAFILNTSYLKAIFITGLIVLITFIANFAIWSSIERSKIKEATLEAYEANPQSRPLYDSLRPVSYMSPRMIEGNIESPLEVTVHVIPSLSDEDVKVTINEYIGIGETGKNLGEGILIATDEEVNGRIVYKGSINIETGSKSIEMIVEVGEYRDWFILDSR